jgi:hypothetical protein
MSNDDGYAAEVIRTVSELTRRVEGYQKSADDAQTSLVEAWRIHREVINRAIGYLNKEVIEFRERLDQDDKARIKRQEQIDVALQNIQDGQAGIRKWQWIRLGAELAVILIVAAYLVGMSR